MRKSEQRRYNYVPQQKILKKNGILANWENKPVDHKKILQTQVNGTLTIELRPGVSERINIKRVIPYREPAVT